MAFYILTRFVLVKYSCAFVERSSQGTSSLASQLTTVSLELCIVTKLSMGSRCIASTGRSQDSYYYCICTIVTPFFKENFYGTYLIKTN